MVLDTGATANHACFGWLDHHNRLLARKGYQKVPTYPSPARFRFVAGRLGEVRHAAGIPVGIAGGKGDFSACAPDADIPALFREGALDALGGNSISRAIC